MDDEEIVTCLDCGAELDDGWPEIGPYTVHRAETDDDRPFCRACVKRHLYDFLKNA